MNCHFCDSDQIESVRKGSVILDLSPQQYQCSRCGHVYLTRIAAEDLPSEGWYQKAKRNRRNISIWIRNEYERRNRKPFTEPLSLDTLKRIVKQYSPFDPVAKMENALLNINKQTEYVGYSFAVPWDDDYPYYHCYEKEELAHILTFLIKDGFIAYSDETAM